MWVRTWSSKISHSPLVGVQHGWFRHFGRIFSYKTKHALPYDPAIMLLGIYPKALKIHVDCTEIYKNCTEMFRAALFIIDKLWATKMSCSRWVSKHTVVPPHNAVLFGANRKWAVKSWKDTEEPYTCTARWVRPIWKGYTLHDSSSLTF